MHTRLPFVVLGCLLAVAGHTPADEAPEPDVRPLTEDDAAKFDLQPLAEEVRRLVQKHYPKAKVILKDQVIRFGFNTRKFMIYTPFKDGEWQDAREVAGPQNGGILGTIALREGRYDGQAHLPQAFDKCYFTTLVMAPYSKELDHYLDVHVSFPRDVPKDFLKEFQRLVNGFDKHVQAAS